MTAILRIDPRSPSVTRGRKGLGDYTIPISNKFAALGPPVLEDAAQAIGASAGGRRAGSLGRAATFSFFPSKNLPCLGDGGAIATDDDDVAVMARRLRFHGSADKQTFEAVGYNSRLDELQAAVLRVLLPELDGWNAARRAAAAAGRGGGGRAGVLPRAGPPATRDGRVRARSRCTARHRGGGPHQPGASHGPGALAGRGRRGDRRTALSRRPG